MSKYVGWLPVLLWGWYNCNSSWGIALEGIVFDYTGVLLFPGALCLPRYAFFPTYGDANIYDVFHLLNYRILFSHYGGNTLVVVLGREDTHGVTTKEKSRFRGHGTSRTERSSRDCSLIKRNLGDVCPIPGTEQKGTDRSITWVRRTIDYKRWSSDADLIRQESRRRLTCWHVHDDSNAGVV